MEAVLRELRRILKPGGRVAFEVGEVRKGTVRLELEIIQAYLPAALSDEDLTKIISDAVAQVAASGSTGPSAMGAVMKIVSPLVSGRANGGAVAAAVKSALA
jgi:uncharacterized protein YqeY